MYSLQDTRWCQELFQGTDNVLLFDLDGVTQAYQFAKIYWTLHLCVCVCVYCVFCVLLNKMLKEETYNTEI